MSNKPIIVIDPGHGGTAKVGGSSPNNAKGANGLLEKNLTLDMANRVAATLAQQASVFLTRASDTNLGLSDRAKFARDKNANIFLSLHFNGFDDANVDGTEVWVAKKANQKSRDLAQTLLSKVVGSTHIKDRGVREGDLGVILPERHDPATSACLLEISFLSNPNQAKHLESDTYRRDIANSICEAIRQHLSLASIAQSFFYVSDDDRFNSTIMAGPTIDEIAKKLGYSDLDDYVAKEVKPATLFGLAVDGGLRPDFYKKLKQAEDDAKKLISPTPTTAKDWGITSISGCQVRRRGWHPWGMAVDIDYVKNPYVMHESGEPAMDKLVTPIYHRIARLVLNRDSVVPKGITESVKGETKAARTSRLYDSLKEESDAMVKYFKAMQDTKLLQKELDKHDLFDSKFWEGTWGVKDMTPSHDMLQEIMMKDYVLLSGKAGPSISGKTYPDPKVLLKGISGDVPFVKRDPEKGFLAIRKEIITCCTNVGLRWGAIDFGGESGDVMHVDDGNGTFAGKINKAKAELAPAKTKSLGYERDYEENGSGYAASLKKTYTVADVKWAHDTASPDYFHIAGNALDTTPFDFTAAHLSTLCDANRFNVKSNEKDPRDEVIFALRGCCLGAGKHSSGGFVSSVKLQEAVPDHQQSRCVIGVWKRSTNKIAVFLGSTVPYWSGMLKQLEEPTKKICNLLPTGRYFYTIGTHRETEKEWAIFGAFRQQSDVPCIRTKDNLVYEISDEWDFGEPGDNIHPSRHPKPTDQFSSEGCMTSPGGGKNMTRTEKHDGLWADFREAAGLTKNSAPTKEDGFKFVVVVLTGREARLASTTKKDLVRLRFGSEGDDVKLLQDALASLDRRDPKKGKYYAGTKDSQMGRATTQAYVDWQNEHQGMRDGIVTWADAKSLGIDIVKHVKLEKPQFYPRLLSYDAEAMSGAVPRKLTDDEIKFYKKLDTTQSWKDKDGNRAVNGLWKDEVIYELPATGTGYTIYNLNDLAGRSGLDDPTGLDEIGTKETIERIIRIGEEWNKVHPDQALQIGDISRPGGIDTPDHRTHMDGKAFDMRALRLKNGTGSFTHENKAIYSPDLTKEFIRCVRLLYPKATFYYNDKGINQDNEFKSFVTHQEGHDNHIHVMLP